MPRDGCNLVARSGPHRLARTRKRGIAQRRAGRVGAKDGRRVYRGDCGERDRRAALSDPERRHRDGGPARDGAASHELCVGRHQLDARCCISVRPRRRDGRRCRRYLDRYRPASPRVPARGQLGRRGGRCAHLVPDARFAVDRAGRRQSRLARSSRRRPAQRRLSADPRSVGVRRRYLDRDRCGGRCRGRGDRRCRTGGRPAEKPRACGSRSGTTTKSRTRSTG